MSAGLVFTASLVLADDNSDVGKAGPLALLIILLLVVVCYFLFRSMSRHLRKVREDFPTAGTAPRADGRAAEPPAGTADDRGP
ncbi:MAG: hypothetical protein ABJA87_05795 [bacterium]